MEIIHVNKNNCLCNLLVRTYTASWDWTDAMVSSTTYTVQPSLLLLIFLAEFSILYWEHFFCENKKCLFNLDRDVSSERESFHRNSGSISRHFWTTSLPLLILVIFKIYFKKTQPTTATLWTDQSPIHCQPFPKLKRMPILPTSKAR